MFDELAEARYTFYAFWCIDVALGQFYIYFDQIWCSEIDGIGEPLEVNPSKVDSPQVCLLSLHNNFIVSVAVKSQSTN